MNIQVLSKERLETIKPGEAITLSAVLAVIVAAVVAVVIYKLFISRKGSTTLPGGWKFSWE